MRIRLLLTIFGIVILVFFTLSSRRTWLGQYLGPRNNSDLPSESDSLPAPALRSQDVSARKIEHLQSLGKRTEPAAAALMLTPTEAQSLLICWGKLVTPSSQQDFVSTNKSHWDQFVGSWYYYDKEESNPSPEVSVMGKFLLALGKAGYLDGRKLVQNDDQALDLLAEVNSQDPSNSAPALFASMIENRRGHKFEAKQWIQRAFKTTHFNTYISEMSKRIFARVQTSNDLLQASSLWMAAPIPNYSELRKFLKSEKSGFFAQQMIQPALDLKTNLTDIDWLPIEYATGRTMLQKINPQNQLPSFREMQEQKIRSSGIDSEKIFLNLVKNCESSALLPLVDLLQTRIQR